MARRSFVAGNWKMNKTPQEARALALELRAGLEGWRQGDVGVFPPYVSLGVVTEALKGTPIIVGAQNVFWEKSGAFTGEVSAGMLAASGCACAIVGHSERRQYFGETDETVNKRLKAALAQKLKAIVCVGETKDERVGGTTQQVVKRQVAGAFAGLKAEEMAEVTVAYEPVWAIGTGLTATPAQAQEVHAFIRQLLAERFGTGVADSLRIQYGGSVKADNAKELLAQPDIDGALVGGASLVAKDFVAIVKAAK
jgi:triosephosphate isomerase